MALLMEDDDDEAKHKHFNYDKIVEQQNLSRRKRKKLLRKGEAPLEDDGFQVRPSSSGRIYLEGLRFPHWPDGGSVASTPGQASHR